jgi:hypothetical protein
MQADDNNDAGAKKQPGLAPKRAFERKARG